MKIGIVSNLYPPQARGGAELVAQRVADALYEQGHDVFVLTTEQYHGLHSIFPHIRERHLEAVYRFFPLNLYYIKHDRYIPFPIRAFWHLIDLFSPFARRAVRHVIQDEDPDVIITHNLKGLGVSVGKEIQKQGVLHIHTLHDVQLSVPSGLLIHGKEEGGLNSGKLRKMYERGVVKSIGKPDAVVSPSKFLADFYKDRGMFSDSQMHVIPNPLPPVDCKPRGKRVPGPARFLYVGQLEKHKGIVELFEAMEHMGTDLQVHIAGDGSLSDYVTARASLDPRVHFHGFVSMQYLMNMITASDAILVPSLCYENSPTVIYESYKVGVPVIASRIGGIPELVKDGDTGILVEPGSVPSLVSAMKRIIEDKDVWWSKTQRIFEHGLKYDIKGYVSELEKIIEEIK